MDQEIYEAAKAYVLRRLEEEIISPEQLAAVVGLIRTLMGY
jgi:hypothetical protein